MLADPKRIQVLWALADAELSVSELAEWVGKPAPSVFAACGEAADGAVGAHPPRRHDDRIFYSRENEHVRQLVIDAVFNAEHAGPAVSAHHHRDDRAVPAITTERRQRKATQR